MVASYLNLILLIVGCTALAVLGLLITRRKYDVASLSNLHEVGGYLFSVIGTLYAVLLGLVVVDAMSKFDHARSITEQEANSLADIFLLAEQLPTEKRLGVQHLCLEYVDEVINNEWKAMDEGKVSLTARRKAIDLMRTASSFEPVTENHKAVFPVILTECCALWDNRRARSNLVNYGLPAMEWLVLSLGAAVTVVFTYFFGVKSLKAQIVMTAMVAFLISLNIVLVIQYGYPFSGDVKVHPDAFRIDRQIFEQYLGVKPSDPTS
jgi:hypothetical protein